MACIVSPPCWPASWQLRKQQHWTPPPCPSPLSATPSSFTSHHPLYLKWCLFFLPEGVYIPFWALQAGTSLPSGFSTALSWRFPYHWFQNRKRHYTFWTVPHPLGYRCFVVSEGEAVPTPSGCISHCAEKKTKIPWSGKREGRSEHDSLA